MLILTSSFGNMCAYMCINDNVKEQDVGLNFSEQICQHSICHLSNVYYQQHEISEMKHQDGRRVD